MLGVGGCHSSPSSSTPPPGPLEGRVVLRSNGDYQRAQTAARTMFHDAFQRYDAGIPLTQADRTNLLRGARLCAAMTDYLPLQAKPDFACGQALAALGYHDEAIRRFKLFLAQVSESPSDDALKVMRADAYGLLSVSFIATHDDKAALDAANVALKAYPNTATYLNDRAAAEIQLGDMKAAKTDLTQAVGASAPDDPARAKSQSMLKALGTKH